MTIKNIIKPIRLIYENKTVDLPEDLKIKIKQFWAKTIKENPDLYNGEDFTVTRVEESKTETIMHVAKTDYAHYLYDERIGIGNEKYKCISPWAGILLLTKDDYWVIGKMNLNTSFPGGFQIPGGGIDLEDIENNVIDINESLKRELKEETSLELDKIKFNFRYLECPTKERNVYGFIAVGEANMSKAELRNIFEKYKKSLVQKHLYAELVGLIFLKKEKAVRELNEYKDLKRPYLEELLEMVG